jgi:hypothetical protein
MKQEEERGLQEPLLNNKASSLKSSKYSVSSRSSQKSESNDDSLGFFSQAKLLIYKNLILTFKNPKNLIFLIITPFLLAGFLYLFQEMARNNGKRVRIDTPEYPIADFPRCFGEDCVSLDYRIISQTPDSIPPPWVTYTLNYIKL